jgi:thiopurine S-methyltransferase
VNFWIKAWNEGNIGFHLADIHPALETYWPSLQAGTSVLVPLCGKSRDLLWLEERGLDVIGVEFVESAVLDFFRENSLEWEETVQYGHPCYRVRGRNIRIFVTDFIHFADDYSGLPLDSLYDRAALVAMPADMRADYVPACRKLLTASARGLLVTMQYDSEAMEGPPFSVEPGEVERLWKGQFTVVEQVDMLSSMPRAVASGVQRLDEFYWVLGQEMATNPSPGPG